MQNNCFGKSFNFYKAPESTSYHGKRYLAQINLHCQFYLQSNPHNWNTRIRTFHNSNNLLWPRQVCHIIPNKQTPVIRTPLIRNFYNSNYICWSLQGKYPHNSNFCANHDYFRPIFYKIPKKWPPVIELYC